MSAPARPGQSVAAALDRSEPLAGLMQRLRESEARLAAITALLPAGLRGEVRAGPLDDRAWALLVSNAAAAAKLRQLLPTLEHEIQARGWNGPPLKIKIVQGA